TNKAGAENLVKNPLAIELTKTVTTLNNLLKSLDLTPAQRKELNAGGEENDDGFDQL
ncbi:P27 family phage terminase small subunit, partial [Bacillus glycinifermentans]